jgi:hypothetical protein
MMHYLHFAKMGDFSQTHLVTLKIELKNEWQKSLFSFAPGLPDFSWKNVQTEKFHK